MGDLFVWLIIIGIIALVLQGFGIKPMTTFICTGALLAVCGVISLVIWVGGLMFGRSSTSEAPTTPNSSVGVKVPVSEEDSRGTTSDKSFSGWNNRSNGRTWN